MKRHSLIPLLLVFSPLLAQESDSTITPEVTAIRSKEPIHIDGILKESSWKHQGTDSFTQKDPDEGKPATQKTEVWCAYNDEAFYIAARLHDTAPDSIVGRLGRRDDWIDSDWFYVYLDPYNDGRSGCYFGVNPSGSIEDGTLYNDSWEDDSWDGVWEYAACVDDKGWIVEMRIPYSQLRFNKKTEHVWGINFSRRIQRRAEYDYFVMVPKGERSFVSRFARLNGIKDIHPPRRIEILPYTVGSYQNLVHDADDPFYSQNRFYKNIGADFKIGLGSNLTLDATINPDFGQVEVDPAVINLSDFETYYQEKRPFFIEGAHIFRFGRGGATNYSSFNFGNPNFFYSRRIGRSPHGCPDHDGYVDEPDRTTILSAGKLTGKVAGNWNLGVLSAVTSPEFATVDTSGTQFKEEVEPMTSYNVFRTQKEFHEGRQGLGMIATGVIRNLRTNTLQELLTRQAYAFGVDGWTFLDKDKTWVLTGWVGGSHLQGDPKAIHRVQEAAARYFQRPDADHVMLDTTATSLSGWATRFYLNKEKGNFQFNAAFGAISPGFDTNEMGFQWRSDAINAHIGVGYEWFKPGKIFRRKGFDVYTFRNYDFGGNKTGEGYFMFGHAQLLNYWGLHFMTAYDPPALDNTRTRGGPRMKRPSGGFGDLSFNTDHRKPVVLQMGGFIFQNSEGSRDWSVYTGVEIKPSARLNILLSPEFSKEKSVAQWVTRQEDSFATHTYGTRYIFADFEQTMLSMSTRINWTFTPRLSFQLYMQPFFAVGHYHGFKELSRPESFDFNVYGKNGSTIEESDEGFDVDPDGPGPAEPYTIDNPDFNYKSLRGTAVLRWEYKPGSVLYLVWTHDRSDHDNPGEFSLYRDFKNLASAESNNIFLLKITYWWNP